MFALILMGTVMLSLCAWYLNLQTQLKETEIEVVAYQFLYELSRFQQLADSPSQIEKWSDGFALKGFISSQENKVEVQIREQIYDVQIQKSYFTH